MEDLMNDDDQAPPSMALVPASSSVGEEFKEGEPIAVVRTE